MQWSRVLSIPNTRSSWCLYLSGFRLFARSRCLAWRIAATCRVGFPPFSIVDSGAGGLVWRRAASAIIVAGLVVTALAPLRVVAQSTHVNIAEQGQRTRTDETGKSASTPFDRTLFEAAEKGNTSDIEKLLSAGANVNCALDGDGSPLIGAARNGHRAAVDLLLERGADPNMPVPGDGNPLIMAAREGHAEIVVALLDGGAKVNQIVPGDENALIQASSEGHLEVVKLLVGRGADVNARVWAEQSGRQSDGEWRTPLSMARKSGHTEVVAYLLSVGGRE